ncbi:DUF305 domain-containing protein [Streptomyces sp. NEAU-W12]|uniref:DUF305 domain-containing protein n=1 Tax=Streptomyces sp. NEAU-W12 TaxID=2994668 RepID=UPI00224AEF82|nr:DUF305 domain-containing protein [Streptomyces sp. NEAU-W12]MCX2922090.1 DUF305 domain-containing protein [Streptomyces sp. NEAU-W12]
MTSIRSLARRTGLVATAATAALVLAAGGGEAGSDTGSGAPTSASAGAEDTAGAHSDQDVSFAQEMIPHHQQALQMAEMAATRASSAEVKDLVSRIEKAQDPEIETMSGWLEAWGEDVPSSMPGMHHGSSDASGMPGMMDTEDMDELMKASGKGFDTMFLTMMVEHHEGAVEMATTEKDEGRYGPAKKLAGDIITAQNAEIEEMNKLLGRS